MKRNSQTVKQNQILKEDLDAVLSIKSELDTKRLGGVDITRILGVVSAGNGAENFLPCTIPKMIEQVTGLGLWADIIIGLNHGFDCSTVFSFLATLPNTQIIHLNTTDKVAEDEPTTIYANRDCEFYRLELKSDYRNCHRIFAIHQKPGLFTSGKIRILCDIYDWLAKNIKIGWPCPEFLITFDAESQFLFAQEHSYPFKKSNGLAHLMDEFNKCPGLDIVSTRNKFAVYRDGEVNGFKVLIPDFHAAIPVPQLFLDIMHGRVKGFRWLPGGGSMGRSEQMICLMHTICTKYPGSRIEDTHLTILSHHLGWKKKICMDVVSTNRVIEATESTKESVRNSAWLHQMERWASGRYALEINYGSHNINLIVAPHLLG